MHAAHQPALLPELRPPPPAPDMPIRLAVMGLLLEDAHVYTSPDGATHLQVLVAQHLQRHPEARHVMAIYHYPDQGTPHATAAAARDRASRLRAGTEVVISGEGLAPGRHHGDPVNVLHGVRAIALAADLES